MKVNVDYATADIVVRLSNLEARRLTAVILKETEGSPDPEADVAAQLDDALAELFA